MQNKSIIVIAVIASLIASSGSTYLYISNQLTTLTNENANLETQFEYLLNQVTDLTSEKNQLQNRVASLTEEKETLEAQVNTLSAEKRNLQEQVNSLTSENMYLNSSIDYIAESIDAMHSGEFVQSVEYNITAGTELTKYFLLDKYGIVWETVIDFSGTSVRVVYYYWYKGIRNYVISFSRGLTTKNNPDITYYGPQNYISGIIKIDITPDWKSGTQIWIGYYTRTQFQEVRWNGNMFIDIES